MSRRSPDTQIAWLAERQHGIFTSAQALEAGCTPDMIKHRLRAGRWRRLHRGVYLLAGVVPGDFGVTLAAVAAAGPEASASHRSAAAAWGLEGIGFPSTPDVLVLGRSRPQVRGVRAHRTDRLPRRDITHLGSLRLTSRERTIIDLASAVDDEVLEYALDDALRRGFVDSRALLRRVARERRSGRPGLPVLHEILEERAGKPPPASHLETRFLRLIRTSGLPSPARQYVVRGPDGRFVARPDYAYPDGRLAIELDSYKHHGTKRPFERDRARWRALAAIGWMVLPVTDESMDEPDEVLGCVRAAVQLRVPPSVRG